MRQTLFAKLLSPRKEHPLELEGLRMMWWMHIALAGFVAVLFRMWDLGTLPGVNGDEAWYGMIAGDILAGKATNWVTPTGNPLNPFFFGPLLFLHTLFGPSFTILRVVAVVSGLAALVVNMALCRNLFGERTAVVSTLLLAVLPINIAYSRFGWDTSQTLLATVFVLYACAALARCGFDIEKSENITGRRKRRPRFQNPQGRRTRCFLLAALALAASILVHPTNIFLAPMVVVSGVTAWQTELRAFFSGPKVRLRAGLTLAAFAVFAAAACVLGSQWVQGALRRVASAGDYWQFGLDYSRLFSGVTVYRYIAGSCLPGFSQQPWIFNGSFYDMLGMAVAACAAFGIGWWLWKARPKLELALTAGYLLSVLGFFLVAGPESIAPHFERYALCLIAPAVLLAARAGINLFDTQRGLGSVLFAGVCWMLLLSFMSNYFWFMEATGGESHRAFRTAKLEPKRAAYELIKYASEAANDEPVVVYASESWNFRPLAYLAMQDEQVSVRPFLFATGSEEDREAILNHLSADAGTAWIVEFAMGESLPSAQRFLDENAIPWRAMEQINDYAGRPVLILLKAGQGADFSPVVKPESP